MNLSIDEIERRLWIEGRTDERRALLQFEEAFRSADDNLSPYGHMTPNLIAGAGYLSTLNSLEAA